MTIEGDLADFAHLETIYLGILARQSRIATNVRRVVEAANGKSVLFFPARYDSYVTQEEDGYAAMAFKCDSTSSLSKPFIVILCKVLYITEINLSLFCGSAPPALIEKTGCN